LLTRWLSAGNTYNTHRGLRGCNADQKNQAGSVASIISGRLLSVRACFRFLLPMTASLTRSLVFAQTQGEPLDFSIRVHPRDPR